MCGSLHGNHHHHLHRNHHHYQSQPINDLHHSINIRDHQSDLNSQGRHTTCRSLGISSSTEAVTADCVHWTRHKVAYSCGVCNREFGDRRDLQRHMHSHDESWPFRCLLCGKSFSCQGHLNMHIFIHTDENRFVCSECNKAFAREDYLKRHMGRMHQVVLTRVCSGPNRTEVVGDPKGERVESTEVTNDHDSSAISASAIHSASPLYAETSWNAQPPAPSLIPTSPIFPLAAPLTGRRHLQLNFAYHSLRHTNVTFEFPGYQEELLDLVIHNRVKDELQHDQPLDLSNGSRRC